MLRSLEAALTDEGAIELPLHMGLERSDLPGGIPMQSWDISYKYRLHRSCPILIGELDSKA